MSISAGHTSLPPPYTRGVDAFLDLFRFHHVRSWNELGVTAKVMLIVSFVQATILIVINSILIEKGADRCADPPCEDVTNRFYSVTLYIIAFSLPYFACSAIYSINQYEHFAYVFNTIMIFVYSIIQVSHAGGRDLCWILFGFSVPLVIIASALSFSILKDMGLETFKIAIKSSMDRHVFRMVQAYQTIVKFDLLCTSLLIIMSGIYFFFFQKYQIYLTIIAGISSVFWATMGWYGVREETHIWTILYYAFSLLQPIYTIYKMVDFFDEKDIPTSLFICAGTASVIIRLAVTISHAVVRKNYLEKRRQELQYAHVSGQTPTGQQSTEMNPDTL